MMDARLERIKEEYARLEPELIVLGGRVFKTSHGIFGTSDLDEVFAFFSQIDLSARRGFVDLGSGDGRIAILASLFTRSIGIEAEHGLCELGRRVLERLRAEIPELSRCELREADYTDEDFGDADVFFIYADHRWDVSFERALLRREGTLYSYQDIFRPERIKKGKTLWIGQTPIVSYPLRMTNAAPDISASEKDPE